MDLNNERHLIIYIVIGGFFAYVLAAMLSAIFLVPVPQSNNWCLETMQVQTSSDESETRCVKFKNDFEMAKYYHNKDQVTLNKWLIFFNYIIALFTTSLLFYLIPKWKGPLKNKGSGEELFSILFLAFLVSIVVPLIFSWILPPPVYWFPSIFTEINNAQVNEALRQLR